MIQEQTALLELVRISVTERCKFTDALQKADWKELTAMLLLQAKYSQWLQE